MLNRLPILLAQIEAGKNSIKLKNEARQILYSLYRFITLGKMLNQLIMTISSKYQHLHGMKLLIYLMDRIVYQKYKIISNI